MRIWTANAKAWMLEAVWLGVIFVFLHWLTLTTNPRWWPLPQLDDMNSKHHKCQLILSARKFLCSDFMVTRCQDLHHPLYHLNVLLVSRHKGGWLHGCRFVTNPALPPAWISFLGCKSLALLESTLWLTAWYRSTQRAIVSTHVSRRSGMYCLSNSLWAAVLFQQENLHRSPQPHPLEALQIRKFSLEQRFWFHGGLLNAEEAVVLSEPSTQQA